MIRTNKKSHRTVKVADPDFGCASVEIERAFFVDFRWGVGWRKDLDADFGGASEKDGFLVNLRALLPEPRNVGRLDSIGSRNGTFGERGAVGEQALEESGGSSLASRVTSSGRWTHNDMSVPIRLDPVGKPGELWVSHELAPTGEVEAGLRLDIGELNGDGHEVTKSMKSPSKQRVKSLRAMAISCLGGLALLWALFQAGLRINGTHSEPQGIYWAVSKPPAKGDLVFALPPAEPVFKLAKERGYLAAGPSPAGTCALIKCVAAAAGDCVTIDAQGVWVNGHLLKNSAPRPADEAGRPLRPYFLSGYTLGPDEVLLMSDYSPASFDSRYFGPLSKTTIQTVIVPIITWK